MAIRKYKPTTPGRRGASVSDFAEVTRSTPEKSLVAPKSKTGGRKTRRTRYGMGRRPNTKRAIISVAAGDRIDIFQA